MKEVDCSKCLNRGAVNGISQDTYCSMCVYQGMDWRKDYYKGEPTGQAPCRRNCEAQAFRIEIRSLKGEIEGLNNLVRAL